MLKSLTFRETSYHPCLSQPPIDADHRALGRPPLAADCGTVRDHVRDHVIEITHDSDEEFQDHGATTSSLPFIPHVPTQSIPRVPTGFGAHPLAKSNSRRHQMKRRVGPKKWWFDNYFGDDFVDVEADLHMHIGWRGAGITDFINMRKDAQKENAELRLDAAREYGKLHRQIAREQRVSKQRAMNAQRAAELKKMQDELMREANDVLQQEANFNEPREGSWYTTLKDHGRNILGLPQNDTPPSRNLSRMRSKNLDRESSKQQLLEPCRPQLSDRGSSKLQLPKGGSTINSPDRRSNRSCDSLSGENNRLTERRQSVSRQSISSNGSDSMRLRRLSRTRTPTRSEAPKKMNRKDRLNAHMATTVEKKSDEEKRRLQDAFSLADLGGSGLLTNESQILVGLCELGIAPRSSFEKRELLETCREIIAMVMVDFQTFVLEAVPQARRHLAKIRRPHLRNIFDEYDLDHSGTLDKRECERLVEVYFTWDLDEVGQQMQTVSLTKMLQAVERPKRSLDTSINFNTFQSIWGGMVETYVQISKERKRAIITDTMLGPDDILACPGYETDIVRLHDVFLRHSEVRKNRTCMPRGESLRRAVIELGLLPPGQRGFMLDRMLQAEVDSKDSRSALDFKDFLTVVRDLREVEMQDKAQNDMRVFMELDADSNGYLTASELAVSIEKLGITPHCKEDRELLKGLLDEVGAEIEDAPLDIDSFRGLVQVRFRERLRAIMRCREYRVAAELGLSPRETAEFFDVFYTLDDEQEGLLSFSNLRKALDMMRVLDFSRAELLQLVASIDPNLIEKGLIFERFLVLMMKIPGALRWLRKKGSKQAPTQPPTQER